MKVLPLVQDRGEARLAPQPPAFCPACGRSDLRVDVVRELEDQVRALTRYACELEDELARVRLELQG
jgi:hypothetical protein